ncbi:MAG: hypothetical protein Q4D21_07005 [Phascolarctobacterium sp.]|nr:hypothetical protein [Phascolarctobacterium sp.]
MLYLLYFLVIGSVAIVCKILYNIFPMFGLGVSAIMVCFFLWLFVFKRRNDRYVGMDPNRSIKEQEEERMRKKLEEANKAPEQNAGEDK